MERVANGSGNRSHSAAGEVVAVETPDSIRIANRPIRTTADVRENAFAQARDVIRGLIPVDATHASLRGLGTGLRATQLEMVVASTGVNPAAVTFATSENAEESPRERRIRELREELSALEGK